MMEYPNQLISVRALVMTGSILWYFIQGLEKGNSRVWRMGSSGLSPLQEWTKHKIAFFEISQKAKKDKPKNFCNSISFFI